MLHGCVNDIMMSYPVPVERRLGSGYVPQRLANLIFESFTSSERSGEPREVLQGIFANHIAPILIDALKDLRANGLLKPCANLNGRAIPEMEAWNAFVAGKEPTSDKEAKLLMAPFEARARELSINLGDKFRSAFDASDRRSLRRRDVDMHGGQMIVNFAKVLTSGNSGGVGPDRPAKCPVSGKPYIVVMREWQPVLCEIAHNNKPGQALPGGPLPPKVPTPMPQARSDMTYEERLQFLVSLPKAMDEQEDVPAFLDTVKRELVDPLLFDTLTFRRAKGQLAASVSEGAPETGVSQA